MKLILHIGSDKTGTTAIQSALHKNRELLASKRVLYPKLNLSDHHGCLVIELRDGKQGTAWKKLNKQIGDTTSDVLIISSEAFCTLSKKDIKLLGEWLNPDNVTVICYLRSADQYLESGFMQRLKDSKSDQDFSRLYLMARFLPAAINPIVYQAGLKNRFVLSWQKNYSPKKMIVRQYNKEYWKNGSILDDFFYQVDLYDLISELGIQIDRRNASLSVETIYATIVALKSGKVVTHCDPIVQAENRPLPMTSYAKRKLAYILSYPLERKIWGTLTANFAKPKIYKKHNTTSLKNIKINGLKLLTTPNTSHETSIVI
jgi:hypothetical protein